MGLNIKTGEIPSTSVGIANPPLSASTNTLEFQAVLGEQVSQPEEGSVVFTNNFVGTLASIADTGVRTFTVKYDPMVFKPVEASDYILKFFGAVTTSLNGSERMSVNYVYGTHGGNDEMYNTIPEFGFSFTTNRLRVNSDIIDTLLREDTFMQIDCGENYSYYGSLNTDSFYKQNGKARLELDFTLGTNKRFLI